MRVSTLDTLGNSIRGLPKQLSDSGGSVTMPWRRDAAADMS